MSLTLFSPLSQCCDLGYHASLNRALRTYLSAEYNLETSRHEGLDIIENAVDSLDPRSDRQRFMEMYPTAFCPPTKFEFQPHMGDEVHTVNSVAAMIKFLVVLHLLYGLYIMGFMVFCFQDTEQHGSDFRVD